MFYLRYLFDLEFRQLLFDSAGLILKVLLMAVQSE